MTRETLDRKLQELIDEILVLGSMVEKAILGSVDALKRRDIEESQKIYDADQQINKRRFQIENDTIILIKR